MSRFDELLAIELAKERKPRQHHDDEEHRIQASMVRWFRLKYPKLKHTLFAVPNGANKTKAQAAKFKAEGLLSGVSDLILLKSNRYYGALLIEVKTATGRQSDNQKLWQAAITQDAYKYIVVRSLDDFIREVTNYLKDV